MGVILRRIREVGVQYKINLTEYETSPLQTAVGTEQIRNVQDSERYAIHVTGTKTRQTRTKIVTLLEQANRKS